MTESDRTFAPTARKLRRARERGEVAASPLLGTAAATLGAFLALAFGLPAALDAQRRLVTLLWAPGAHPAPGVALTEAATTAAILLALPLTAAVVLGALGGFAQVGPLWSTKALRPDLARLDAGRGLARAFGPQGAMERVAGLPLALVLAAVAILVLRSALPGLLGRVTMTPEGAASATAAVLGAFGIRGAGLLLIAAIVAAVYRRHRYWREQHMTRREVLDEQRETEGEPLARRRRAEAQRERALGPSMGEAARDAALVVVGAASASTLVWTDEGAGPVVTFSARGAARDRLVARAAGRPVLHDDALAAELSRAAAGSTAPRSTWRRLARGLARGVSRTATRTASTTRGRPRRDS